MPFCRQPEAPHRKSLSIVGAMLHASDRSNVLLQMFTCRCEAICRPGSGSGGIQDQSAKTQIVPRRFRPNHGGLPSDGSGKRGAAPGVPRCQKNAVRLFWRHRICRAPSRSGLWMTMLYITDRSANPNAGRSRNPGRRNIPPTFASVGSRILHQGPRGIHGTTASTCMDYWPFPTS